MRFSRSTLVALARVIVENNSHTEIDILAYEFRLDKPAVDQNKLAKCLGLVAALEKRCEELHDDQEILKLLETVLSRVDYWRRDDSDNVAGLLATLSVDGFELQDDKLVVTTPGPARLGPEVSAVEQNLSAYGLNVAASHYSQAVENLARGNFEAANGQLRSFMEDLFISICKAKRSKNFKDARSALQHMKDSGFLEPSEWNMYRGFWDSSQNNGPHHGLSDYSEALYRLHVGTAIARYMLRRMD